MALQDVFVSLENSAIGTLVRGDSGWVLLFPNVETVHVLALAVVFGSILMIDLRLLGITSRNSRVSTLSSEVLPYTWIAFIVAAISGTLMFVSRAVDYSHNLAFQLKLVCLVLAGVNMFVFHRGAYRHVLEWDAALPPPTAARVAGSCSLLLWVSVVFLGRWIGWTL